MGPAPVPIGQPKLRDRASQLFEGILRHSASLPKANRGPECTSACVTAIYNMAELAEESGDLTQAREKFQDVLKYSKMVYYEGEATDFARAGLDRIASKLAGTYIAQARP